MISSVNSKIAFGNKTRTGHSLTRASKEKFAKMIRDADTTSQEDAKKITNYYLNLTSKSDHASTEIPVLGFLYSIIVKLKKSVL